MTRPIPVILMAILIASTFIVPAALVGTNSNITLQSSAIPAQIQRDARVAIYDENNLTVPAVSDALGLTNNISEITTLLEGAGHSVEHLSTGDILNHELVTADYDVFILVNNIPRESISKLVKEFWMGGGGLLTFHGAVSFLWYEGIIFPDQDYDVGHGTWWGYLPSESQNVTSRHSTMKGYHVNDTVYERAEDWATSWEPKLIEGRGDDMILLMNNATQTDYITAFAIDNSRDGGNVVQLPGDGYSISTDFESIIVDSVEWLIPRPKGRIAYDLSHQSRLCVDEWDDEFATAYDPTNSYTQFRTLAVNHSYTFDKFYPSASGNLTAERLAKYDVLVICWPDIDYTSAERAAVEAWVDGGGSLLVLGDRTGLAGGGPGNTHINQLLHNFDMSLGTTDVLDFQTMTPGTHLTLEGCTGLYIGYRNYLSVIGNATAIWLDGTDPAVAGQEFGQGRAILSADMNIFVNGQLDQADNLRYALNALNWLTACDADILVFTTYGGYHAEVVTALRNLGHPYQLFETPDYLNDFLDSKSWGLAIIDQSNSWFSTPHFDALYAYVDGGGKLIMSYFDIGGASTHPLWSKLGVEYSASLSGSPEMFIWDTSHDIFNEPNDHSNINYTSNVPFADDGDTLTVLPGFTALAGSTTDEQDGSTLIVVSNDKQTLYNGYLIDTCTGDEDNSTYSDSAELWQNEIVFMLAPSDGLPFTLDPMTLLIIGGVSLAVIVIAVAVSRRKSGGAKPKPRKKSTKKK
ncbi:MAG: hypothetical protein JSW05_01185 [Candidatus Thorarchaeota archaeon]|nr:MAG: hypothetical protein JSW05_01185 [Candidatus Thorarchaeota archaeon]